MSCKCGDCFVDGGKDYLRRGFKIESQIEDLSVVEEPGPEMDEQNDNWTTSDLFKEAS